MAFGWGCLEAGVAGRVRDSSLWVSAWTWFLSAPGWCVRWLTLEKKQYLKSHRLVSVGVHRVSRPLGTLSAERPLGMIFPRLDYWWLLQKRGRGGTRKSLPFPLRLCPSDGQGICLYVCLPQSPLIKRIPGRPNTWIQRCFCLTWFNPCSPRSALTTTQRVHLKKGWPSPAEAVHRCGQTNDF